MPALPQPRTPSRPSAVDRPPGRRLARFGGGWPVALGAVLAGCGVAGRPLPPGPTPPAAPVVATPVSTPDGVSLTLAESLRDVDGAVVDVGELWAYPADADCVGAPIARGPLAGLVVPAARLDGPVRLVAVRGGRVGPPSAPVAAGWTPPPAPPEAPLAFVDASGQVQVSWLPPEPPIVEVEILRDGAAVARAPAEAALWSERPAAGRHRYAVVGLAPGLRTAPSAVAEVLVR